MSTLAKQMQNFATDYFNTVGTDSSNFDYDFDADSETLKITEDGHWVYTVDKRTADFDSDELEAFALSARDANNSDVYMLPICAI